MKIDEFDMIKDFRVGLSMQSSEDRKKSNLLLVDYFYEILEKIKPTCSVEIGANSAEFSRSIKIKHPNIKSFAFEANKYNFDFYCEKYNYNSLDINYINKAVSDKNDQIKFIIQKKINDKEISPIRGNNSILNRVQENTEYEELQVDSITLDNIIYTFSLIEEKKVLWIDVEGANKEVLMGGKKTIQSVDIILIEVEEKEFWKEQWLETDVDLFLRSQEFLLIARDGEFPKQHNRIYINSRVINTLD